MLRIVTEEDPKRAIVQVCPTKMLLQPKHLYWRFTGSRQVKLRESCGVAALGRIALRADHDPPVTVDRPGSFVRFCRRGTWSSDGRLSFPEGLLLVFTCWSVRAPHLLWGRTTAHPPDDQTIRLRMSDSCASWRAIRARSRSIRRSVRATCERRRTIQSFSRSTSCWSLSSQPDWADSHMEFSSNICSPASTAALFVRAFSISNRRWLNVDIIAM